MHFQHKLFMMPLLAALALSAACSGAGVRGESVAAVRPQIWLTDPAAGVFLSKQADAPRNASSGSSPAVIRVNSGKTYQSIDGFGFTLTGGSARLINAMPAAEGDALLRELFSPAEGIGTSFLRVSVGASDLDPAVFSYDDMPPGRTDPELASFSLAPDREALVPVLRRILAINPEVKILASPWSAPAWMKVIRTTVGSSLKPAWYPVYAQYLVKYVQGMKAEGIDIHALTIQNEPLNPDNNPSMIMPPAKQALFVKAHLGPAFAKAGIKTKIVLYDHNCDEPGYPLSILDDPEARPFVDGSAFHLYDGDISALSKVHDAYPDKNVYFTEQWVGAPGDMAGDFRWHLENVVIGSMRNWSRVALEWNLASDPAYGPHTPGGCDACLGAISIGSSVKRNPAYYIIAQASKFVRPGSVRVESSVPEGLPNAAFKTPDGKTALIVLNTGAGKRTFSVYGGGGDFDVTLAPGAAATCVW